MGNNFVVYADIGCDHRRADSHVLQNFVTAFPTRPNRIPERHNSNVETGQVRLLGFHSPHFVFNMDAIELERFVGDNFQLQSGKHFAQSLQRRLNVPEIRQSIT